LFGSIHNLEEETTWTGKPLADIVTAVGSIQTAKSDGSGYDTTELTALSVTENGLLAQRDTFEFDTLAAIDGLGNKIYTILPYYFLDGWGCISIPEQEGLEVWKGHFRMWTAKVYATYQNTDRVPYHNVKHGLDVMQGVHAMLMKEDKAGDEATPKKLGERFTKMERCSLLFAAFVHDLHHDGFSNHFHEMRDQKKSRWYCAGSRRWCQRKQILCLWLDSCSQR
jgi:hypothetical protein